MVQLRKIVHRENYQIGIYFGFDDDLQNKAKSLGAVWSQTYKCWYLLYSKENYNRIKQTFEDIEIIQDKYNERQPEPAGIQQENVHIAEVISAIRPSEKAEHKGTFPEIAGKIVYRGITGKYWILKVPYKESLAPKLMDIKGVYWNKTQKAFFVLRHVNVKIKVEALLGIGEIFPPEYYNLETAVSNANTFIELNEYLLDKKWTSTAPRLQRGVVVSASLTYSYSE
jgi:integrase/recombinase XerD